MNEIVESPFGANKVAAVPSGAVAQTDQQRAIAEVQAAMMIARMNPRDERKAMDRILMAFSRPTLAEKAEYSYSRGGQDIAGPSIRSAEAIAQLWGNMQFGIRELSQHGGESEVEAYAWDVENNTRREMKFRVPHIRHTRQGAKRLEDPRDVYELVANNGSRRLRACILAVVPGDVIEAAMKQADTTLRTKADVTPERLQSLLEKFAEFGVSKAMLEKRIQRNIDAMTPALLVGLGKVYNSLKDGMGTVADFFEVEAQPEQPAATGASATKDAIRARQAKKEAPKAEAPAQPTLEEFRAAIDNASSAETAALALDEARDVLTAEEHARLVEAFEMAWKA